MKTPYLEKKSSPTGTTTERSLVIFVKNLIEKRISLQLNSASDGKRLSNWQNHSSPLLFRCFSTKKKHFIVNKFSYFSSCSTQWTFQMKKYRSFLGKTFCGVEYFFIFLLRHNKSIFSMENDQCQDQNMKMSLFFSAICLSGINVTLHFTYSSSFYSTFSNKWRSFIFSMKNISTWQERKWNRSFSFSSNERFGKIPLFFFHL